MASRIVMQELERSLASLPILHRCLRLSSRLQANCLYIFCVDMSIVELLKTVDQLAKAVVQKNSELEILKNDYDLKIKQMNKCLTMMQELLEEPLFSSCSELAGPDFNDSEFLVVPKSKIRNIIDQSMQTQYSPSMASSTSSTTSIPSRHVPSPPTSKYTPPHKISESNEKKYLKVACSFCNEHGHTRARCINRLNTPKK